MTKYGQRIEQRNRFLAMLRNNEYPNYERFMAELRKHEPAGTAKMAIRTFRRFVSELREECSSTLGGIEYDASKKGYCLSNSNEKFLVPAMTDEETRTAAIGAILGMGIMPGSVGLLMQRAVDKLLGENDFGNVDQIRVNAMVACGTKVALKSENEFLTIYKSWQHHHLVRIGYQMKGYVDAVVIEPHVLTFYDGKWYVYARRVRRDSETKSGKKVVRTYAIHRIVSSEMLAEQFEISQDMVEAARTREIFNLPKLTNVKMRVTLSAEQYLMEKFDYKIENNNGNGTIDVVIPSAFEYLIINYIIVQGGEAVLLNYPDVRKKIRERLEAVMKTVQD